MGEALSSLRCRYRVWREGAAGMQTRAAGTGMQTRAAGTGMSAGQQDRTRTRTRAIPVM